MDRSGMNRKNIGSEEADDILESTPEHLLRQNRSTLIPRGQQIEEEEEEKEKEKKEKEKEKKEKEKKEEKEKEKETKKEKEKEKEEDKEETKKEKEKKKEDKDKDKEKETKKEKEKEKKKEKKEKEKEKEKEKKVTQKEDYAASKDRLQVRYSGSVYDVTEFADRHPGGKQILNKYAGQDVTELMNQTSPHRHSNAAYSILAKYRVLAQSEHDSDDDDDDDSDDDDDDKGGGDVCVGGIGDSSGDVRLTKRSRRPVATTATKQGETREEDDYSTAVYHRVQEDDLVDWGRPLLAQVPKLGHRYQDWVHQPVDHPIRLFRSDFLEALSKSPWYAVPAFWGPLILLLLWNACWELCQPDTGHSSWPSSSSPSSCPSSSSPSSSCPSSSSASSSSFSLAESCAGGVVWRLFYLAEVRVTVRWVPVVVGVGGVVWTLCEYSLHRWLFHMTPPPSCPPLLSLHFMLHGHHHKAPMDRSRLVFPVFPACVLGGVILGLYSLLAPGPVARLLFCGTALGYVSYDLTHYYLHHGAPPPHSYLSRLKRYHVKHHFHYHNLGFGISSKFWDYPFGTLIPDTD